MLSYDRMAVLTYNLNKCTLSLFKKCVKNCTDPADSTFYCLQEISRRWPSVPVVPRYEIMTSSKYDCAIMIPVHMSSLIVDRICRPYWCGVVAGPCVVISVHLRPSAPLDEWRSILGQMHVWVEQHRARLGNAFVLAVGGDFNLTMPAHFGGITGEATLQRADPKYYSIDRERIRCITNWAASEGLIASNTWGGRGEATWGKGRHNSGERTQVDYVFLGGPGLGEIRSSRAWRQCLVKTKKRGG